MRLRTASQAPKPHFSFFSEVGHLSAAFENFIEAKTSRVHKGLSGIIEKRNDKNIHTVRHGKTRTFLIGAAGGEWISERSQNGVQKPFESNFLQNVDMEIGGTSN